MYIGVQEVIGIELLPMELDVVQIQQEAIIATHLFFLNIVALFFNFCSNIVDQKI